MIDENNIVVSTHLFRIVLIELYKNDLDSNMHFLRAFVISNVKITNNKQLKDFAVNLEFVEKKYWVAIFHHIK
jgi:DNA/RNA endonuclease G (NUC1)